MSIRKFIGVLSIALLMWDGVVVASAQAARETVADLVAGYDGPKAGVFTPGGASDVATSSTYWIDMGDVNRHAFDSAELEAYLAQRLDAGGLGLKRVGTENEAELLIHIRIDAVPTDRGAGISASVFANIHRKKPTKHQLLYGYEGIAETPEAALAKFAKVLSDGARDAQSGGRVSMHQRIDAVDPPRQQSVADTDGSKPRDHTKLSNWIDVPGSPLVSDVRTVNGEPWMVLVNRSKLVITKFVVGGIEETDGRTRVGCEISRFEGGPAGTAPGAWWAFGLPYEDLRVFPILAKQNGCSANVRYGVVRVTFDDGTTWELNATSPRAEP